MAFGIALSGLAAAQSDLNVTSNNIANSETTGFKSSLAEFSELYSVSPQGVAATQTGNGVEVAAVKQAFTQGNIATTGNSLDLAISGSGFFTVSNGGSHEFTRSGSFTTDNAGYVVNSANERLQVYPPTTTGFNTSTLQDLRLVTTENAPKATTSAQMVFNLPAAATPPADPIFSPTDSASYNNATALTMYDSLGAAHTGSLYFVNTGAGAWDAHLYIDGTAVGGAEQLAYSSAGAITTPAGGQLNFGSFTPASTGASAMSVNFNFAQTTQYGGNFGVTSVTQDGYTTGQLTGVNVDATGVVQAKFTNGQSVSLGQVAIANFANQNGLQQLPNTNWSETYASGQPLFGQAGNSTFGNVQSGALEASNVDITQQLVKMITAQRDFQANAQMISTENSVTQTIIQMSH